MLQTAKEREKKKLIAKRENLRSELGELGCRIEEFLHYRELDRMLQVQLLRLSGNLCICLPMEG